MLILRPHHILCLQGFQGHGYDSVFIKNLAAIHESVSKNPDQIVQISCGIDDICEPCPNHREKICAKSEQAEKNIQAIDRIVLSLLDLPYLYIDSVRNIFTHANRVLKTKNSVKKVCGSCEWREKCFWHQSRA